MTNSPVFIFRSIISVVSLCFISKVITHAATPFQIAKIFTEAENASPVIAQQKAILKGQQKAAQLLIKRLTLQKERAEIGYHGIGQQEATKLVSSVDIIQEKRSSSRYMSVISVHFNPLAVKQYLKNLNLSIITEQAAERVIIPIEKTTDNHYLSNHTNWRKIWYKQDFTHVLTPVISINELENINADLMIESATSGQTDLFRYLAEKMQTQSVLLAILETDHDSKLFVRLIDIFPFGNKIKPYKKIPVSDPKEAPKQIIALIEQEWKKQHSFYNQFHETLQPVIQYHSLYEWLEIKNILKEVSLINQLHVRAISKFKAYIDLSFKGSLALLKDELNLYGLTIIKNDLDQYIIQKL